MINWTLFRIFGTIAVVLFCVIGATVFTFLCLVLVTWIQQEIRMKKEAKHLDPKASTVVPIDDYAEMHASLLAHLDNIRGKL